MKYSIIIPTLNEENYVGILLDSLVKQSFKDFEVIVIDADSEDATKDVVEKYKDKLDLQFVVSPKRGVGFQRNYASRLAKYENIIFFDADVAFLPDFLETVNENISSSPVDVLTSWNVPITDKEFDKFMFWFFNQFYMEPMKKRMPAAGGAFIYVKKSSFEDVGGFDEEVVYAEDFDLVRRLFKSGFKYRLLKNPKLWISPRRWEKEGRLNYLWRALLAGFHYHIKGPIKSKEFEYEFGMFGDLVSGTPPSEIKEEIE